MGGIKTSVTCHCKAKGTREVQTRKAVLAPPAWHLLFGYQHLVASLLPAVTPTHQMNAQQDEHLGRGEPARKSCLLALKKRLGNSCPPPCRKPEQKAAALLKHSPIRVFLSPPHPKTPSICWPQRGYASLYDTFRAQKAALSSASEDLTASEMGGQATYRWDSSLS